MKKKILSVCLVAVVAVMAIAGASLAYFTDTDDATNVFTVGGVDIKLVEQQRDGEGGLESFENDKVLMPIVGSAEGEKDEYGLPTANNYVDKIVTVENTGKSAAFVRVLVAIPSALQGDNAAAEVLHWDNGNKFTAAGDYDTAADPQPSNEDYAEKCVFAKEGQTTIGDIEYDIYSFTYTDALAAGDTTEYASLVGFYLDKNLDARVITSEVGSEKVEITEYFVKDANGGETTIEFDLSKGVNVPVYAQAVQAAGFDSAADAFAASGLTTNPWDATEPE